MGIGLDELPVVRGSWFAIRAVLAVSVVECFPPITTNSSSVVVPFPVVTFPFLFSLEDLFAVIPTIGVSYFICPAIYIDIVFWSSEHDSPLEAFLQK